MPNNYSMDKIQKDFMNRRISKRVAKQRLLRCDTVHTTSTANETLKEWAAARTIPKNPKPNNQGIKTGAKGKREQAVA